MDESGLATVIIRDIEQEKDLPFIYATWRNSWYYGLKDKPKDSPKLAFIKQTVKIREILKDASTRIACLQDDLSIIIGYVVFTGSNLDWIYVKKSYRNKGIGKLLMPNIGENCGRTEDRQTNQGI